MQTFGFVCGLSGLVVLDAYFSAQISDNNNPIVSSYITIPTSGTEGSIVYEDSAGVARYWPYAVFGYNPIGAKRILTSATINGVLRTTTATPLGWAGSFFS